MPTEFPNVRIMKHFAVLYLTPYFFIRSLGEYMDVHLTKACVNAAVYSTEGNK